MANSNVIRADFGYGSREISYNGEHIPVIKYEHMPLDTSPFGWAPYDEEIFSFYRGVIVQWDEDRDARVLSVIDDMADWDRAQLVQVRESEGCISLLWNEYIPVKYENLEGIYVGGDEESHNDYWCLDQDIKKINGTV